MEGEIKEAERFREGRTHILSGNPGGVAQILSYGFDPNVCDEDGMTLVMFAAAHDRVGCLRLLLEAGGDLLKRTPNGFHDAFTLAGRDGSLEVLKVSVEELERSKHPGLPKAMERSLAWACSFAQRDCVIFLLEKGAKATYRLKKDARDGNESDPEGELPEEVADKLGYSKIAGMLKAARENDELNELDIKKGEMKRNRRL